MSAVLAFNICRVRLADGVPRSFDETYLPLETGKKQFEAALTPENVPK